jgi:hypothetical protein
MVTLEPVVDIVIDLGGAVFAIIFHGSALGLAIDTVLVVHWHWHIEWMCSRERA